MSWGLSSPSVPRMSLGLGPYLATGRVDDHLGVLTVTARRMVLWERAP